MLPASQMVLRLHCSLSFLLITSAIPAGEEVCWLYYKWSIPFIVHQSLTVNACIILLCKLQVI